MYNMADIEKQDIGANPLGSALAITVQMPQEIEIQMVNAANMTDYQVWSGISAFLSNVVVGFFVAALTHSDNEVKKILWIMTGIFSILLVIAAWMAIRKIRAMKKDQKPIKFEVTRAK